MKSNRSGRDVDAALCKKGFEQQKSGDHIRYYLYDRMSGATLAQTKISHGMLGTAIGPPLIAQMARQLRITKDQFLRFIDCTMSEEEYRVIVR